MSFFKSLFNETADHGVHKKHLKRVSKSCKILGDVENSIPVVRYPLNGTKEFNNDIEEVERCFNNKSLTMSFLNLSHDSVEDVFKKFLSEESRTSVNWEYVGKLLDEVDSIILRMKYKNKRPRPKVFLSQKSPVYENIHESKSFSFPSGHTAIAYFLSGILSKMMPELKSDLEMLSNMVGHSRIENGVHYPTDVSYGRLIGEMLADHFNNLDNDRVGASEISTSKNKKISQYFRDTALDCRPSLDRQKAYSLYVEDLARFVFRVNELCGIKLKTNECVSAAKSFLQGYPPQYCSKNPNVQSVITCLALSKLCNKIDTVQKIVGVHKGIPSDCFDRSSPGELRNHHTVMHSGVSNTVPEQIFKKLRHVLKKYKDPIVKHALILHINPFSELTNLIAVIVLACDLDYNFDIINQVLDEDYTHTINQFLNTADLTDYLK